MALLLYNLTEAWYPMATTHEKTTARKHCNAVFSRKALSLGNSTHVPDRALVLSLVQAHTKVLQFRARPPPHTHKTLNSSK